MERTYLAPLQIAQRLGVHKMTVYKWIWSGELPSVKLGRSVRVAEADLAAFLEARRVRVALEEAHEEEPAEEGVARACG